MKRLIIMSFLLLSSFSLIAFELEFIYAKAHYSSNRNPDSVPNSVTVYFDLISDSIDEIPDYIFIHEITDDDFYNREARISLDKKVRKDGSKYRTLITFNLLSSAYRSQPVKYIFWDIYNLGIGWLVDMKSTKQVEIERITREEDEETLYYRKINSIGG
jgi:hypothetical protein